MKRTVKQWCLQKGYNWYGPGVHGNCHYDYKIILADGRKAFFRTAHGRSSVVRMYQTRHGEFAVFPVFSQVIGKKEMSLAQFEKVLNWVEAWLAGDCRQFHA